MVEPSRQQASTPHASHAREQAGRTRQANVGQARTLANPRRIRLVAAHERRTGGQGGIGR